MGEGDLFIGGNVPNPAAGHAPHGTAAAERRALRRFAGRMAMFWTPLLLLFFGIELLLWRVGETWPLERVMNTQEQNRRAYFARATIDQGAFRYKYLEILRRRPEILVLGSSRMMQFRAEMFGRQAPVFYNAAGMTHSIQDLNDFIDRLPAEATPKIVLIGIDFWWLNANARHEANDAFTVGIAEDGTFSWQGHAHAVSEYVKAPRSLGALISHSAGRQRDPDAIGLQAQLHRQGFRPDGSKRFALKIPQTPEGWTKRLPAMETVKKDILGGSEHFAFTDGVAPPLAGQLKTALARLKARGILVIGYSPPVITAWAQVVSTAPHQADYWKQFHETIAEIFRSLELPLLDVETPAQLGLDDRYMRDAYHAYDTFNLHVLQRLCEIPQIRAAWPDVPGIAEQALASPRTNPLTADLPGAEEEKADVKQGMPKHSRRPKR